MPKGGMKGSKTSTTGSTDLAGGNAHGGFIKKRDFDHTSLMNIPHLVREATVLFHFLHLVLRPVFYATP